MVERSNRYTRVLFLELVAHLIQSLAASVAIANNTDAEEDVERYVCLCAMAVAVINQLGPLITARELAAHLRDWDVAVSPAERGRSIGTSILHPFSSREHELAVSLTHPHAPLLGRMPCLRTAAAREAKVRRERAAWFEKTLIFLPDVINASANDQEETL